MATASQTLTSRIQGQAKILQSSESDTQDIRASIRYSFLISWSRISQANCRPRVARDKPNLSTSQFAITPAQAKDFKGTDKSTCFDTLFQKHRLRAPMHHRSCAADQAAPPTPALARSTAQAGQRCDPITCQQWCQDPGKLCRTHVPRLLAGNEQGTRSPQRAHFENLLSRSGEAVELYPNLRPGNS